MGQFAQLLRNAPVGQLLVVQYGHRLQGYSGQQASSLRDALAVLPVGTTPISAGAPVQVLWLL
ncbi:MAG: hypothetical protein Q6J46_12155 [Thermostichus sp. DG02_2_bins_29]